MKFDGSNRRGKLKLIFNKEFYRDLFLLLAGGDGLCLFFFFLLLVADP